MIAALAGLLSGLLGSLGMGGGAVLLIYLRALTDTDQLQAQGINLFFFLPIAALSLILHSRKKLVEWKTGLLCALAGIPMAFLGVWLAQLIGSVWLSKGFAVFLLYIAFRALTKKAA